LADYNVKEGTFVIIMISKPKTVSKPTEEAAKTEPVASVISPAV